MHPSLMYVRPIELAMYIDYSVTDDPQGYDEKKDAYIAAQGIIMCIRIFPCVLKCWIFHHFTVHTGPVEVSVGRFWSMVWEYKLHTIVMLTQCVEAGKVYV